jgi:hypothetical protein
MTALVPQAQQLLIHSKLNWNSASVAISNNQIISSTELELSTQQLLIVP